MSLGKVPRPLDRVAVIVHKLMHMQYFTVFTTEYHLNLVLTRSGASSSGRRNKNRSESEVRVVASCCRQGRLIQVNVQMQTEFHYTELSVRTDREGDDVFELASHCSIAFGNWYL